MHYYKFPSHNSYAVFVRLRWRHNELDGVSNHQPHICLLNRLFRRRSKKASKLRVTGLCVGNSPGPVNSPHKWPVTRKMFPFDDVIMETGRSIQKSRRHRLGVTTQREDQALCRSTSWHRFFAVSRIRVELISTLYLCPHGPQAFDIARDTQPDAPELDTIIVAVYQGHNSTFLKAGLGVTKAPFIN